MKIARIIALILVMLMVLGAASADSTQAVTYEGPGFESPDAAVLAYIDALDRGSVDGMLATFATESLVDHLDACTMAERLKAFNLTMTLGVPFYGDYGRSLLVNARRADLTRSLLYQYIELSTHLNGQMYKTDTPEALDALFGMFADSPVNRWQGATQFVGWVSPTIAGEALTYESNLSNVGRIVEHMNPDDVAWRVAHLKLDGVDALLFMQCGCYGGRWYNLELGGVPANIMGLDIMSAGLLYPDEEDIENMGALTGSLLGALLPTPGGIQLNAAAQSGLGGTRWTLTGLSDAGIAVQDSAEAALADEGTAVWGELRLYSVAGGIIKLRVSPALQTQLGMAGQRARIGLAWTYGAGRVSLTSARAQDIELDLEGARLEQSGDTLTLALPNGTTATFARVE